MVPGAAQASGGQSSLDESGNRRGGMAQRFLFASKPVSRILYLARCEAAIIPLGPAFRPGSSNLPESRPRA